MYLGWTWIYILLEIHSARILHKMGIINENISINTNFVSWETPLTSPKWTGRARDLAVIFFILIWFVVVYFLLLRLIAEIIKVCISPHLRWPSKVNLYGTIVLFPYHPHNWKPHHYFYTFIDIKLYVPSLKNNYTFFCWHTTFSPPCTVHQQNREKKNKTTIAEYKQIIAGGDTNAEIK